MPGFLGLPRPPLHFKRCGLSPLELFQQRLAAVCIQAGKASSLRSKTTASTDHELLVIHAAEQTLDEQLVMGNKQDAALEVVNGVIKLIQTIGV